MPTYEFVCECGVSACGRTFDLRLSIADRNEPQRCPSCTCWAKRREVPSKAPMVVMTSPQEVMGGHTKERMLP